MRELIILAGGLGTRLRSEVPELPKCMAPINERPFIDYVMEYFISQKVGKFIFALGYKSDILQKHLIERYSNYPLLFSIEKEQLGTGGAILQACSLATEENIFVTNGDTLFKANLETISNLHIKNNAACTLALKPMKDFERFGVVTINPNNCITSFQEKKKYKEGLINGGLYLINKTKLNEKSFPQKFSFEQSYLETFVKEERFYASIQDAYFIDMGIPEDYRKAAIELK